MLKKVVHFFNGSFFDSDEVVEGIIINNLFEDSKDSLLDGVFNVRGQFAKVLSKVGEEIFVCGEWFLD